VPPVWPLADTVHCKGFYLLTSLLLVGQQARHPVTCKVLCPLILQCFDAVGEEGKV